MSDVADLDARRRAKEEKDYVECPCGSAWFELRGDPEVAKHGAVSYARSGKVNAVHGVPHCLECGRLYVHRRH